MTELFVVLKQNVENEEYETQLLSINHSHIEATESLLKFLDDDKEEYDECIVVNKDRHEIFDRTPRWSGKMRDLKRIYSIQKFIHRMPDLESY